MLTILYTDEMKCMSILFTEAVADPGMFFQTKMVEFDNWIFDVWIQTQTCVPKLSTLNKS